MFDLSSIKLSPFGRFRQNQLHDSWYCKAISDCTDGTWDWDFTKQLFTISPKLRELLGYEEAELVGLSPGWWLEQIHPEDQVEIQKQLEEASRSNSDFIYFETFRFLCKGGPYIWLENHAKILRNKNGTINRMTGVVINTTAYKLIQSQFRSIITEQQKEAENRLRFLSTLSHEFRSPLSGIIGMSTLLNETSLSQEQRHFTDNISNSTEMLLSLVNDILDVTKLNSGKFKFENIRYSPIEVIKKSSELIRPGLLKKDLEYNTIIDEDVPECLIGDPTRLQQILVNLLTNASKFTSKGGITLLVRVDKTQNKQNLYFEISDTGMGISPEDQITLFEDYSQANRSISRIYGGTGLGLSICKELVHLMGGDIGVTSELDLGSTFWFSFPIGNQDCLLDGTTPCSINPANSPLSILLVEDDPISQEVMEGLLTLLGKQVTIASNGEEAVRLFASKNFDLIFMDLNLPILDGLQAAQLIRDLPNGNIPIIAVTANTFGGNEQTCQEHGINLVLNKPITKTILEEVLNTYHRPAIFQNDIETDKKQQVSRPSTIDQKTLKSLIKDLGAEKVTQLLTIYRNDALSLVNQIKNSPNDSKDTAHKLAGMSDNLGICLVGKTARDIMGATQNAPEKLPILIQDLESQFNSSLCEIHDVVFSSRVGEHNSGSS
ncbi:MAG: response regulator [Alphaproteobacteria bacterium]|nr:response regulator [Alphaproteobacteria bacterium]